MHLPPTQAPFGQATPQPPQCLGSTSVLVHVPPQNVVPPGPGTCLGRTRHLSDRTRCRLHGSWRRFAGRRTCQNRPTCRPDTHTCPGCRQHPAGTRCCKLRSVWRPWRYRRNPSHIGSSRWNRRCTGLPRSSPWRTWSHKSHNEAGPSLGSCKPPLAHAALAKQRPRRALTRAADAGDPGGTASVTSATVAGIGQRVDAFVLLGHGIMAMQLCIAGAGTHALFAAAQAGVVARLLAASSLAPAADPATAVHFAATVGPASWRTVGTHLRLDVAASSLGNTIDAADSRRPASGWQVEPALGWGYCKCQRSSRSSRCPLGKFGSTGPRRGKRGRQGLELGSPSARGVHGPRVCRSCIRGISASVGSCGVGRRSISIACSGVGQAAHMI